MILLLILLLTVPSIRGPFHGSTEPTACTSILNLYESRDSCLHEYKEQIKLKPDYVANSPWDVPADIDEMTTLLHTRFTRHHQAVEVNTLEECKAACINAGTCCCNAATYDHARKLSQKDNCYFFLFGQYDTLRNLGFTSFERVTPGTFWINWVTVAQGGSSAQVLEGNQGRGQFDAADTSVGRKKREVVENDHPIVLKDHPRTTHFIIRVLEWVLFVEVMCEERANRTAEPTEFTDKLVDCVQKRLLEKYECHSEVDRERAASFIRDWEAFICPNFKEDKKKVILDSFRDTGIWFTTSQTWTILGHNTVEKKCLTSVNWRSLRSLWSQQCDAAYLQALSHLNTFLWDTARPHLRAATNMRISCMRRLLGQQELCNIDITRKLMLTIGYVASMPGYDTFDEEITRPGYRPVDLRHEPCPERHTLGIWSMQFMRTLFGGAEYCPLFTQNNATLLSTDRMTIFGTLSGTEQGLKSVYVIYYKEKSDTLFDAVYTASVDPLENFRCRSRDPDVCLRRRAKIQEKLYTNRTDSLGNIVWSYNYLADDTQTLYDEFVNGSSRVDGDNLRIRRRSVSGDQAAIEIYDVVGQTLVSIVISHNRPRMHVMISIPDYVVATSHGVLVSGCPVDKESSHERDTEEQRNIATSHEAKISGKCAEACSSLLGAPYYLNSCLLMCYNDVNPRLAKQCIAKQVVPFLQQMQKTCGITSDTMLSSGTERLPTTTTTTTAMSFLATVLALCIR